MENINDIIIKNIRFDINRAATKRELFDTIESHLHNRGIPGDMFGSIEMFELGHSIDFDRSSCIAFLSFENPQVHKRFIDLLDAQIWFKGRLLSISFSKQKPIRKQQLLRTEEKPSEPSSQLLRTELRTPEPSPSLPRTEVQPPEPSASLPQQNKPLPQPPRQHLILSPQLPRSTTATTTGLLPITLEYLQAHGYSTDEFAKKPVVSEPTKKVAVKPSKKHIKIKRSILHTIKDEEEEISEGEEAAPEGPQKSTDHDFCIIDEDGNDKNDDNDSNDHKNSNDGNENNISDENDDGNEKKNSNVHDKCVPAAEFEALKKTFGEYLVKYAQLESENTRLQENQQKLKENNLKLTDEWNKSQLARRRLEDQIKAVQLAIAPDQN